MNAGRRAYDLLRGYVNTEWERIRGVDESAAEKELRESLEKTAVRADSVATPVKEVVPVDPQLWARNILGVSATADFSEIRKQFEKLNSRSDPGNFPSGSAEAKQASDIHRKIQQAYGILTESIDSTEKRFKTLEID